MTDVFLIDQSCFSPPSQSTSVLDMSTFREQFPVFAQNPDLILFDNASTTQKPECVLQAISDFHLSSCANTGRASYSWSSQLTSAIEKCRLKIGKFLNVQAKEIIFTGGATDSLNTVALSWGLANLRSGDEIMLCLEDHKSAVLPWFNLQRILAQFNIEIRLVFFKMHDVGEYDLKSIAQTKTDRTRLIALSHIHHVYGVYMEIEEIRAMLGGDVLISLDCSQSVSHTKVDAKVLGVDFISFSAHKLFASNGLGVLWVHSKLHESLSPMRVGGKDAISLLESKPVWPTGAYPALFEGGTGNIPGILSLSAAVDFIESYGLDSIENRVAQLTQYLHNSLKSVAGVRFAPGIGRCICPHGYGIIAFALENISSNDLAAALDNEGIFVRAGDQCVSRPDEDEYVRVSMHAYNNESEIDRLIDVILFLTT